MPNPFKESITDKDDFTITWELVPGRGAREVNQEEIFEHAEEASKHDLVDAISLTDNPSGNPAISAEYLGMKLKEMGLEPLVHFTAKDKSRNEMESFFYSLERENVQNLLLMTGDFPSEGYDGQSKPVFDIDSTHMIEMVQDMNEGLKYKDSFGRSQEIKETHFFPGAVVSPFKQTEAEVLTQYYKLEKKAEAGAEFVITQLGFDARKFHELKQYVDDAGIDVPLIGNVYILSYGAGRAMNRGDIPGCVVTDDLVDQLSEDKDADDGGKEAYLTRAAKMYAFLKGMGYDGVHIGGHGMSYEDVEFVVDKGEELLPDWGELVSDFDYPMEGGFYVYERDASTGLNSPTRAGLSPRPRKGFVNMTFRLMHNQLFEPDGLLFKPMQLFLRAIDGTFLEEKFQSLERITKTITNDCQECGDCALTELAYICPMSQCPKNQRNGPCGGSRDGMCEVYPDKQCIYVRSYNRLKEYGDQEQLKDWIPAHDWELNHTSSWLNYWLGRDHASQKVGIEPYDPDEN
ncbi:MAG: methylenetetrahydrofolate reductase C-terminal domain-containing protein [Candidatus Bipolaricaulota bacterium]